MPSTQSDALRDHFQSMSDRMAANPEMELRTLRSMLEELADRAAEPTHVTYEEVDAGGPRTLVQPARRRRRPGHPVHPRRRVRVEHDAQPSQARRPPRQGGRRPAPW